MGWFSKKNKVEVVEDNPSLNTLTVDISRKMDFLRLSIPANEQGIGASDALKSVFSTVSGITRMDAIQTPNGKTRLSFVRGTGRWSDGDREIGRKSLEKLEHLVDGAAVQQDFNSLVLPDNERVFIQLVNNTIDQKGVREKLQNDGGDIIVTDVVPNGKTLEVHMILFGSCADCQLSSVATLRSLRDHVAHELNNLQQLPPFNENETIMALENVLMNPIDAKQGFFIKSQLG